MHKFVLLSLLGYDLFVCTISFEQCSKFVVICCFPDLSTNWSDAYDLANVSFTFPPSVAFMIYCLVLKFKRQEKVAPVFVIMFLMFSFV